MYLTAYKILEKKNFFISDLLARPALSRFQNFIAGADFPGF
jgi:hypothetical protein